MKPLIYNTEARAKKAAKSIAIAEAEKFFSSSYKSSTEKNMRLSKNWLIEHTDTHCVCGQTGAIQSVLFHRGQQFQGMAGYCKYCGSENPMP